MEMLQKYKQQLAQRLNALKDFQSQQLNALREHYRQEVYNKELASYKKALCELQDAIDRDAEEAQVAAKKREQQLEPYKDKPVLYQMMKKAMNNQLEYCHTRQAVAGGNYIIQGFEALDVPLLEMPS